jgi:Tfp pilus assembly protein PilV
MGSCAAQPGPRSRAARGVSFLEVVFAMIVLAMTVATLATGVNAIANQQGRSRQLLNCAEIANRLIIQYLDDRKALPSEDLTIPYGDEFYRYRKNVTRVAATLDETVERNLEAYQNRQPGADPDRLKKVVITVWLSERSGGGRLPDMGAPQQTLVRVVDPYAFGRRSPDSLRNLLQNDPSALIEEISGSDVEADEEDE